MTQGAAQPVFLLRQMPPQQKNTPPGRTGSCSARRGGTGADPGSGAGCAALCLHAESGKKRNKLVQKFLKEAGPDRMGFPVLFLIKRCFILTEQISLFLRQFFGYFDGKTEIVGTKAAAPSQ